MSTGTNGDASEIVTTAAGGVALAHTNKDGSTHALDEHLRGVGQLARAFAARFDAGALGELAGLWHDLGKYAPGFQRYLRESSALDAERAHLEDDKSPAGAVERYGDHASAGAHHARSKGLSPLAFAIAGHHSGLADKAALSDRLARNADRFAHSMAASPPSDILDAPVAPLPAFVLSDAKRDKTRRELWIRMIFSALCDADFLDTEAFFDRGRTALRAVDVTPVQLAPALRAHLDHLESGAADTEVNRVRREVRAACHERARDTRGFFTLTVPTGGGKTLASLAFALDHAAHHGLDRVVVAIPFTSIIEQSAEVFRRAIGAIDPRAVLEHHSAFDPSRETPWNRIASENWDAPIVVTTTVQLFESLFARKTSRCRKLHRLARSVIVLDEAQTVPAQMLEPILDVLETLVADYGASIVFCTATQPAFGRSDHLPIGLEGVREIVPPETRAFERLRRVEVRWPSVGEITSYESLARDLAAETDALAIVHKRADARTLVERVDAETGVPETLHLSALMCAAHRSEVLAEIKARKQRREPVRLVATQLVEAGVDLDFPIVFRALAGIDALAQAAGRCNREGRLDGLGTLRVYRAETRPPQGILQTALGVTETLLAEKGDDCDLFDLFDPTIYVRYFRRLYGSQALDAKKIQEARRELQFEQVATRFQMIENDWSAPVVVPFGDAGKHLDALARFGPSRDRLRALQRFTVTVPKKVCAAWLASGAAANVADTVVAIAPLFAPAYSSRFGLQPDKVGVADIGSLYVE